MQKNEFLLINNTIYQLYTIEDFDSMKVTFLNLIKLLIPNTCASILMADHTDSSGLLCDPICVPASYTAMEESYLNLEESDCTRWLILCKQSTVIRESDLTPEQDRIQTRIYQECYAPYQLHDSLQMYLVFNNCFLGVVTLYRKKEEDAFTDDELFTLKSFCEHLSFRFYQEFKGRSNSSNHVTYPILTLIDTYHLTNRESEVLQMIFEEKDNQEIADELCISTYTLKKHLQNLYKKLDVSTRWDLLKFKNL